MDEDTEPTVPEPLTDERHRLGRRSGGPPQRPTPTPETTDAEFSAFYRSFIKRLVAFLLWQGARMADATEIAQETMTLAYRSWQTIDHPEAWARRVASRGLARRFASVEEVSLEQIPDETALLPSPTGAAAWEQQHEVLQLLQKLPLRQRQVMAWTFDYYDPSDIAKELRITPEAVRSSLKKARRTLARYLADMGGDQE